jgi:plasmid stabilization system protein ParE
LPLARRWYGNFQIEKMKPQLTQSDLRLIAELIVQHDSEAAKKLVQKIEALLRSSGNFEVMAATIGQGIHSPN